MKPIYVTKTPNLYRIQFEYHPKLVEVIKTIPSKPRYDGTDRAWLVSINDSRYPGKMPPGMWEDLPSGPYTCNSALLLSRGRSRKT